MIQDRGSIKWTAMMLPEHVAELRKWMDREHYTDRPALNEFDLQGIQEEIEVAHKRKCETLVETWKDGLVIPHRGMIEGLDLQTQTVLLEDPFGIERIRVSDIISVQCVD